MFVISATTRKKFATLLVVGFLYRLGACPCGCLEHNYWLQALGVANEHHDDAHPANDDSKLFHASNDHDCKGAQDSLFVDNAGHRERMVCFGEQDQFLGPLSTALLADVASVHEHDRGPPSTLGGQPVRALTQVYLL